MTLLPVALLAAAALWGLSGPSLPSEPRYSLPIEEIRLAVSESGTADRVIAHVVAESTFPAFISTAWGGLQDEPRVYPAFEIHSSGKRIVVDAPHPQRLHAMVPGAGRYYPQRYRRLQSALSDSDQLLITHSHGDHVAGIPFGEDPDGAAAKLLLNDRQRAALEAGGMPQEPSLRVMGFPPELLATTGRLASPGWQLLAPGVALIQAPGHTPGHQVIYIATGHSEILLLGDLVWNLANVARKQTRPRFVSRLIVGEDADQVADQLAALIALSQREPDILLVPSHDPEALDTAIGAGAILSAQDQAPPQATE